MFLLKQNGSAKTNATSTIPVIGTQNLNPCATLILYNRKTKTAIMNHRPFLTIFTNPRGMAEDYLNMLKNVRTNPDDMVGIHVVGGAYAKEDGTPLVQEMTRLLAEIVRTPNAGVKTFDVYDKPKPTGVAFDTRNGRLIRDSDLSRTSEEAFAKGLKAIRTMGGSFFTTADWDQNRGMSFDGTAPYTRRGAGR